MYRMSNATTERFQHTSEFLSDLIRWGEKARKRAITDELTGVYNYRYLEQRLTEELQRAKRHSSPLSVIYIDFDSFKLVNDTFGHETGNTVLQRVAQAARTSARGEDFVGRLGGDEFLIVRPTVPAP